MEKQNSGFVVYHRQWLVFFNASDQIFCTEVSKHSCVTFHTCPLDSSWSVLLSVTYTCSEWSDQIETLMAEIWNKAENNRSTGPITGCVSSWFQFRLSVSGLKCRLSLSPWCYLTRCMHPAFPVVFLFWKQLINWTIPWCNGKPCGNVSWANNKPYSNSSSSQARTQKISHLAPQYSQWSCLYNSQAQRIPGISARCEKKSPHTSGLKEGTSH